MNNLFSQSPYKCALNVSVISPDMSAEKNTAQFIRSPCSSDDPLFSPEQKLSGNLAVGTPKVVSPDQDFKSDNDEVSPQMSLPLSMVATAADKMFALIPDTKAGRVPTKNTVSTPHFEKPRVIKGTPFVFARSGAVSPTTSEKSTCENESPGNQQCADPAMALFDSSPIACGDRSIIAELAYNESLLEFAVETSPVRSVSPRRAEVREVVAVDEHKVSITAAQLHFPAPKPVLKQTLAAHPVSSSTSSLFSSPTLLKQAGGVAKGRGPTKAAAKPAATTQPMEKAVVKDAPGGKKSVVPVAASPLSLSESTFNAAAAKVERKFSDFAERVAVSQGVGLPEAQTVDMALLVPAAPQVVSVTQPATFHKQVSVAVQVVQPQERARTAPVMCNVSIQCSSFLDEQLPDPVSRATATHQAARTACVSTQLEDSFEGADEAPVRSAYSPMCTSYFRVAHDSDSEDDLEASLQMGLFDLLQQATTSPFPVSQFAPVTAKTSVPVSPDMSALNRTSSSFRSTAGVLGSARRVTLQEQRQSALEADEEDEQLLADWADSDDGQILLSDYSWPRPQQVRRASQPIGLQLQKPLFDTAECCVGIAGEQLPTQSVSVEQLDDSLSLSSVGDANNFTAATDVAVKFTNESIYDCEMYSYSVESGNAVDDADVSSFCEQGAETTMTLDQSPLVNIELDGRQQECPHLNILSMRRAKDAVPDIKEITLQAAPGAFVTSVLHFSNRHRKLQTMRSQAIPIRFEAAQQRGGGGADVLGDNTYFSVSPSELHILPGEDSQLFITFSPAAGCPGVYTGAVRIRSGHKVKCSGSCTSASQSHHLLFSRSCFCCAASAALMKSPPLLLWLPPQSKR